MTKKKVNIKVMEFDKWLGSQGAFGQRGTTTEDDIDGIMKEAQKMKVQRIRTMELDKYLLQSEQELEKLKRGESLNSTGGSLPSSADFMKMARLMSDLSPEEQKRVANAYAMLRMADKGQVGGSLGLLGPLLGYARQNPGASEEQMIKYLTLMDSQFLKGLETAKVMNPAKQGDPVDYMVKGMELMKAANPPKQQGDPMTYMVKGMELMKSATPGKQNDPMEFLKLMKDLVIEGVRNPLMQAIKESQPTPGVFEQILTKPELWNRFKEIGMFGGGSGAATGEFDLKIEQLRGERMLSMKKLELENKKLMLERDSEDRKTDLLLSALGPIAAVVAGPVSQRMQSLGQQQAAAYNPVGMRPIVMPPQNPVGIPPVVMPPQNAVLIECSCGYEGSITFTGALPAVVNCPQCGMGLNVGDIPIAGKPDETDTGT